MQEEKVKLSASKGVFFNPEMSICRSISSLAVGAIGTDLDVIDAFCASGARGIRYSKENANVASLSFIDIESKAITLAKKNAKANKVKAKAFQGNVSRLALDHTCDFLEIDPFGTPAPYLVDSLRFFNPKKEGYLSITATDVAVLCGGKVAACQKNYHSKPLNNEFTHETGLRILMKRIAEVAAEFNMGIRPLISFSDRHYLKTIMHVKRSADLADQSLSSLGYVSYDEQTGERMHGRFPREGLEYAGQLWLGELHDNGFLEKMIALNEERGYKGQSEIRKMLSCMQNEVGMPPYYYNIHSICRIRGQGVVPRIEPLIERIRSAGFRAGRTHFSDISIKTDAPYKAILEAMNWSG